MDQLSCHFLFVAYDSCLTIYSFDEYSFMSCIQMELITDTTQDGTLMGDEVSHSCSVYDLANRIVVYPIVGCKLLVIFLFSFSFGYSHSFIILSPYLSSYERGYLR